MTDSYSQRWRITWVDPSTAETRVEVGELIAMSMLVGKLMGTGIQCIGIYDAALWQELEYDRAEQLAMPRKSP